MGELSYTTIDKAEWGDGPWVSEPDKIQWIDATTGFDCLIVRSPAMGNLCGYVGVPPNHPCHGAHYDDVRVTDTDGDINYPDVHGGLTYAGACWENAPEDSGICHVPESGRLEDVWWLGFDCMHAWDIGPAMASRERALGLDNWTEPRSSYRDVGYVWRETERLAVQLVSATVWVKEG